MSSRDGYDQPAREPLEWLEENLKAVVGGGLLFVLTLIASCGSAYTVNEGERAIVTRMGAVERVTGPGLRTKWPLVESVTLMSVRTQCLTWEASGQHDGRMETYSRDQQLAHLAVKVCFRVNANGEAVKTIYSQFKGTEGYEHSVVAPRTFVAVKEVFGQFNAIRVVQDRVSFNRQVEEAVRNEIAHNNGGGAVTVDNVSVQDIAFSKAYEQAVEQRMQAEVEVAKVAQNVEREKKSAEIAVVQAQAKADAQVAQAKAAAQATKLQGEAEAAAIRARADALRDNPRLVELTAVERWDGKLPATMVPGASVPFLHVNK